MPLDRQALRTTGVIHIECRKHSGQPSEFLVSFGGKKDGVGAFYLGKVSGFDPLTVLLRKLGVPGPITAPSRNPGRDTDAVAHPRTRLVAPDSCFGDGPAHLARRTRTARPDAPVPRPRMHTRVACASLQVRVPSVDRVAHSGADRRELVRPLAGLRGVAGSGWILATGASRRRRDAPLAAG